MIQPLMALAPGHSHFSLNLIRRSCGRDMKSLDSKNVIVVAFAVVTWLDQSTARLLEVQPAKGVRKCD